MSDRCKEGEKAWLPFREIGSACVGLAAGSFIGWTQWSPVYSGLTAEAKAENYWQGALLGISAVAFVVLALAMLVAEFAMRGRKQQLQSLLLQDMQEVFGEGSTVGESDEAE